MHRPRIGKQFLNPANRNHRKIPSNKKSVPTSYHNINPQPKTPKNNRAGLFQPAHNRNKQPPPRRRPYPLNTGITSSAKMLNCSLNTSSGIPITDPIFTRSTPG